MNKTTFLFTILILLSSLSTSTAQVIEFGAWAGGANAFDDINRTSSFSSLKGAGGLLGRYNFDDRLAMQLKIATGSTTSDDANFPESQYAQFRGEATKTKFTDVSVSGEFNFFSFNGNAFQYSRRMSPYLGAGLGFSFIQPQIKLEGSDEFVNANAFLSENDRAYQSFQIIVPLSAGIKYDINESFNAGVEFSSRLLFNDYYDDFSTQYNQTGINNSPGDVNIVGFQRGDRSRNDVYNIFGVHVTYQIELRNCKNF